MDSKLEHKEVSLFDIPDEMIESKAGLGREIDIDLDEQNNRVNPHNYEISSQIHSIQWKLDIDRDNLEDLKAAIEDGSVADWGYTEEEAQEHLKEIEAEIAAKEKEIAELAKGTKERKSGDMKRLIKGAIGLYAQTLNQRGYEAENAMLSSKVDVSPVTGVPGRYMINFVMHGLNSSASNMQNASMLMLDTFVDNIDEKYPKRNEHYLLAATSEGMRFIGSYIDLLQEADTQHISIEELLKNKYKVNQRDLLEMSIADAERHVDSRYKGK